MNLGDNPFNPIKVNSLFCFLSLFFFNLLQDWFQPSPEISPIFGYNLKNFLYCLYTFFLFMEELGSSTFVTFTVHVIKGNTFSSKFLKSIIQQCYYIIDWHLLYHQQKQRDLEMLENTLLNYRVFLMLKLRLFLPDRNTVAFKKKLLSNIYLGWYHQTYLLCDCSQSWRTWLAPPRSFLLSSLSPRWR